jgi:hypothetical protein
MQKMWHGLRVDPGIISKKQYGMLQDWMDMKVNLLEEIMIKWRDFMKELDIPFILNQSVVLGLYREKRLFEGERVMEFASIGEDITKEKLNELETNPKYQFRCENSHETPHGLLYFRDLELQPIYFKNKKAVYNLQADKCLVYDEELLLKKNWSTLPYKGEMWLVPGNVEKFLEQAYGDWKTPNKSYNWQQHAHNKVVWKNI